MLDLQKMMPKHSEKEHFQLARKKFFQIQISLAFGIISSFSLNAMNIWFLKLRATRCFPTNSLTLCSYLAVFNLIVYQLQFVRFFYVLEFQKLFSLSGSLRKFSFIVLTVSRIIFLWIAFRHIVDYFHAYFSLIWLLSLISYKRKEKQRPLKTNHFRDK